MIYLLLPMPWSFGVFVWDIFWIAGMGMYFSPEMDGAFLAAALAGTAFAFNGLTWYGLMWPHIIAGLAWAPWVVMAVQRGWQEGRRSIVLAILAAAMQLLSGGAEIILQTWAFCRDLVRRGGIRVRNLRRKLFTRALAIGFGAIGLAAVQLGPFLELLAHSQRNAGYSSGGMAAIAAMPLTGWANYLVHSFVVCATATAYCASNQSWTGSYYLGVGIVALALVASAGEEQAGLAPGWVHPIQPGHGDGQPRLGV